MSKATKTLVNPIIRKAMDATFNAIYERVLTVLTNQAKGVEANLKVHEWDINECYPYPSGDMGRTQYHQMQRRRVVAQKRTIIDTSKPIIYIPKSPTYVVMKPMLHVDIQRESVEEAEAMLESFAIKMGKKAAEHGEGRLVVAAEYHGGDNPWQSSEFVIRLDDGTKLVYYTHMIINISCLGKLFNQWPTRLQKS